MNTKDLASPGAPLGAAQRRATDFISKFILGGGDKTRLREEVAAIVRNPAAFTDDPLRAVAGNGKVVADRARTPRHP